MAQIEPSKIFRIEMSGSERNASEVLQLENDWSEVALMCSEDSTRISFNSSMTPYIDQLKSRTSPLTLMLAPGTKIYAKAATSSVVHAVVTQSPWAMMLGAICAMGRK